MLLGLLRAMRPHQWVKNLFVLTPLVFAKALVHLEPTLRAIAGFWLFSMLASAVYLLNDVLDVEADRAHPIKSRRPIASGAVSVGAARGAIGVLVLTGVGLGYWLAPTFALCVATYFLLNVAYSLKLKRIPYVDVTCIALGFELRVLAGASAASVPASAYLLIVTFLLATFLGLGKRLHELLQSGSEKQRAVLAGYERRSLYRTMLVAATLTALTYAVYTLDPSTRAAFGTSHLVVTAPFVFVGMHRFLTLVHERPNAESPTEEMLRDVPFLLTLVAWAGAVTLVLYFR